VKAAAHRAVAAVAAVVGAAVVIGAGVLARIRFTADDAPPVLVIKPATSTAIAAKPVTPKIAPVVPTAPATGPSLAVHPNSVDDSVQWISRLGGPDADAAMEKLVDRGLAELPALRSAARSDANPQVRVRAAALVAEILDRDADGATAVTVHLDQSNAGEAWGAIASQGRCRIAGLRTAFKDRKINLDWQGDSFWSVVTDLCGKTGVDPVVDSPPDHTLTLFPSPHNWLADAPHEVVGPYWVGVVGVDRRRSIPLLEGAPAEDAFDVRLIVYAEPKLSIAAVSDLIVESATDDQGHPLQPQPAVRPVVDRPTGHTVVGHLRYPAHPGKTISEIRGRVVILLAEANQRFRIDDVLGKPVPDNPIAGCDITATVTAAAGGTGGAGGMYRVSLVCDRQEMDDDRWRTMLDGLDDLQLCDAYGKPLRSLPWTPGEKNSPVRFEAAGLFARDQCGEPRTLNWEIASRLKPVDVPVRFHNLPMP
jgi:hypothetical protein